MTSAAPTCDRCGTAAPGEHPPLTWATASERGRTTTLCETCVRDNVRAIESKLDSQWW